MSPDSLLEQLSKPNGSTQRSGNLSASRSTSVHSSFQQQGGTFVEDAILLDSDTEEESGESKESDTIDYFMDYVDLEDYGRKVKAEECASQSEVSKYRSIKPLSQANEEPTYEPKTQSDPGGPFRTTPVTCMYSPTRTIASKGVSPSSITNTLDKTKDDFHQLWRHASTTPMAEKRKPSPFGKPQQRSEQSRSESQAKVRAIAVSARKNHSTLAQQRAEKALAKQTAQCLRNEEKNERSVETAPQVLHSARQSEVKGRGVLDDKFNNGVAKVLPKPNSQHEANADSGPKDPGDGAPGLATAPKARRTQQDNSNPAANGTRSPYFDSEALAATSEVPSSSKDMSDRTFSKGPFGRLILDPTFSAKVRPSPPSIPLKDFHPAQIKLGSPATTPAGPKRGFAAFPASLEAFPSKIAHKRKDSSESFADSVVESNSHAKAHTTPKSSNVTKLFTKDLPPPLPVFDPKRKRPLAHIPVGALFRPDQVVSKHGYHQNKRQRRQEKRDEALHAEEHGEREKDTETALATLGDVYAMPTQNANKVEPAANAASGYLTSGGIISSAKAEPAADRLVNVQDIYHSDDEDELLIFDPDTESTQTFNSNPQARSKDLVLAPDQPPKAVSTATKVHQSTIDHTDKRKAYSKAATELDPTAVCNVFSSLKVPEGHAPAQPVPKPWELKRTRNMVCIICKAAFDAKQTLRMHFPECVQANGNPQAHAWFDHPSVQKGVKRGAPVANQPKEFKMKRQEPVVPKLSKSDSDTSSAPKSPLSPNAEPPMSMDQRVTAPQPTIKEVAEVQLAFERAGEEALFAPSARPTTGRKTVSEATLAKWAAEEASDADDEEEEDLDISKPELEVPDIAYRYYVKRYELPLDQLEEQQPMGNTFGPFYTMAEANTLAEREIHRLDTYSLGNYPRNWRHICDQDELGMRSYTVEVLGMHIETVVYRGKQPIDGT